MQFTLSDIWAHMGLFARGIVGVMVLMSIASVLVIVERGLLFYRSLNEWRASRRRWTRRATPARAST